MYVAIKTLVVRNMKKSPDTDVSVFTGSSFSGRLRRLGVLGQVSLAAFLVGSARRDLTAGGKSCPDF